MPGLNRRREIDGRAGRFESEVRSQELLSGDFKDKRKFQCGLCKRLFEEKSRICPRCEKVSMGEIKQIPEKYREEARRNAIKRASR